jgi:DNA-binding LytR/AlgR family response regulator
MYLKMLCEQFPELEDVKAFNNPQDFVAALPRLEYDFCILDIEMPGMNGLQIARLLKGKPVIFTTAYTEYAAEAFDIDAVDYVRKPIKKERLQQALSKVKLRLQNKNAGIQFIQLNTDKGKTRIYIDQVGYVKTADVDSRDKAAWMMDGTVLTLKNISFEKLRELLPAERFVRINKKEMLALKAVKTFSSGEITTSILTVGDRPLKLTLSEAYRKEFLQKMYG